MPMYEYQCLDCGAQFERLIFDSTERIICKNCESSKVEQQLSVFAIAGTRSESAILEEGPCGSCGAAQKGLCQLN